jgi:transposase-like protein
MEIETKLSGRKSHLSKYQRDQILKEHVEQGLPISLLARKNGINAVTIYNWKRNMSQDDESITPEKIRELLSEISSLKNQNKQLKVKVADLSVTNDILTEAIEIAKKRTLLKQAQLLEKSKSRRNSK